MNFIFEKTMMQRYRSIICVADEIIKMGHKLYIRVTSDHFDFTSSQKRAGDVSQSSKESFLYLIKVFGLKCDSVNDIIFLKPTAKTPKGIKILNDTKSVKDKYITIPYNDYYCRSSVSSSPILVGNPMCELIRRERLKRQCEKGSLLLLHSGGMRGDVSPRNGKISPEVIINNNNKFMAELFSYFPSNIQKVTIKAHPMPHINCDKKSLISHNLPSLNRMYPHMDISVCDEDLLSLLSSHEFVLNFGGSTSLWLLGSDVKWINVKGFSMYPYAKLRENNNRTDEWDMWPQNIHKLELRHLIESYDEIIKDSHKTKTMLEYEQINSMAAISNIMEFIHSNI